jgi:hypothetical protein
MKANALLVAVPPVAKALQSLPFAGVRDSRHFGLTSNRELEPHGDRRGVHQAAGAPVRAAFSSQRSQRPTDSGAQE